MKWHLLPVLALMVSSAAISCTHTNTEKVELIEVWTGDGHPPASVTAPPGFGITPQHAYDAVIKSGRLSLKHRWACYRDERSYYIFDTLGKAASARNAARYGVQVNGLTGDVE